LIKEQKINVNIPPPEGLKAVKIPIIQVQKNEEKSTPSGTGSKTTIKPSRT
jgi:hypothetical protein